jgi:hypothetical protein
LVLAERSFYRIAQRPAKKIPTFKHRRWGTRKTRSLAGHAGDGYAATPQGCFVAQPLRFSAGRARVLKGSRKGWGFSLTSPCVPDRPGCIDTKAPPSNTEGGHPKNLLVSWTRRRWLCGRAVGLLCSPAFAVQRGPRSCAKGKSQRLGLFRCVRRAP